MAGWSAAHRKTAVFGWLLLVAAIFVLGQALGSRQLPQYSSGQAGQAERVLRQYAPTQLNALTESVLIQATVPGATFATDPAMRQAASQVAATLAAQPNYATHIAAPRVSTDSRSALVTFQVPGNVTDIGQAVSSLQHAVAGVQARQPDLRVAETGDASIQQAANSALNFGKAETTSVPITLILMLAVFGSLVAAGIPVLLALTALTAAIGVVTGVSHWLPVNGNTFEVVVVVGMAVGVDYSLFYLRREREERAKGRSFPDALRIAARTSGRTILVSGLTVMAAMSGLFFVGGGPFGGFALGTIAVVGIAVIGSLTVLPALLAWLGPKADAGRIPLLSRRRAAARPSRLWGALARRVVARPMIWGGLATVALLALAAPALGLRLGAPAVDAPKQAAVVQTFTAIQRAFPQAPAPAQVVVTGADVTGPKVLAAVDQLRARAAAGGAIHEPVTSTVIGGGRALVVDVPLAGDGADTASDNALLTLRNQILPDTLGTVPAVSYAVTGDTASTYDDIHEL
ncbi:MAG TPA: MMPL family transporter, partial [Streptosporangiaceae bacterium]